MIPIHTGIGHDSLLHYKHTVCLLLGRAFVDALSRQGSDAVDVVTQHTLTQLWMSTIALAVELVTVASWCTCSVQGNQQHRLQPRADLM